MSDTQARKIEEVAIGRTFEHDGKLYRKFGGTQAEEIELVTFDANTVVNEIIPTAFGEEADASQDGTQ